VSELHSIGVIFDLDGLLTDTEPLWSRSAKIMLERRHRQVDLALKPQLMGRAPADVARLMVEYYQLDESPEVFLAERVALMYELYNNKVPLMRGAQALVQELAQARVPIAVASGSPTALIDLALKQSGLGPYFEHRIGSDLVRRGKPAPDIFLRAAECLPTPARHCLVLEDSAAGVEAALAAQMKCIAVPSPETERRLAARAHLVVESLSELSLARMLSLFNDEEAAP
jgi:HAD superfamily hydrolase (TIGR01509 family)